MNLIFIESNQTVPRLYSIRHLIRVRIWLFFFFDELKCVIDLSLRLDLTKRQRIKEEEKGTKKNQKIQNRPARCTKRVAHTRTAGARRRRRFFCFLFFFGNSFHAVESASTEAALARRRAVSVEFRCWRRSIDPFVGPSHPLTRSSTGRDDRGGGVPPSRTAASRRAVGRRIDEIDFIWARSSFG